MTYCWDEELERVVQVEQVIFHLSRHVTECNRVSDDCLQVSLKEWVREPQLVEEPRQMTKGHALRVDVRVRGDCVQSRAPELRREDDEQLGHCELVRMPQA